MFSRLNFEDWHQAVPFIALTLVLAGFAHLYVRTLRMKRRDIAQMAHQPLEEETPRPVKK